MLHQEVTGLSIVIGCDLIEVALEHYTKFSGENLIMALLCGNIHHLYELGSWIFFDLKD